MSTAAAGPRKSVAVTVIGLITMVWGGSYAALGGSVIFGASAMMTKHPKADNPRGDWLTLIIGWRPCSRV
jgi:hypothetical protein